MKPQQDTKMNTKQTPEQAAMDALRVYVALDPCLPYDDGLGAKHAAARQTIIKAFQDRAELLAAMEGIFLWGNRFQLMPSHLREKVIAAIEKAKS